MHVLFTDGGSRRQSISGAPSNQLGRLLRFEVVEVVEVVELPFRRRPCTSDVAPKVMLRVIPLCRKFDS